MYVITLMERKTGGMRFNTVQKPLRTHTCHYLETVYSTTRRMWSCGPMAQRSWLVV